MKNKTPFTALEHDLIRQMKLLGLKGARLLLAVSGGRDSMVLLTVMHRLSRVLKLDLQVVHVHHGPSGSKRQNSFRDRACRHVQKHCQQLDVRLHVVNYRDKKILKSEEALREFREKSYAELSRKLKTNGDLILATAHHNDDLVETRLLRLIRGTGAAGLESMTFFEDKRLRPFLSWSALDVEQVGKKMRVAFVSDPSNNSDKYLRNWLRHKWLPLLDKKVPSAVRSLGRSLENISNVTSQRDWSVFFQNGAIVMPEFLNASPMERQQVLALYLKHKGIRGYGRSHIQEILKRLDNSRNELKFAILKHEWLVNAQHIMARPQE